MANAGSELAGNDRCHNAGPGLFEDSVSRFIERTWFRLILAAAITSEKRDQTCFDNSHCMPIPARAF